MIPWGQLWFIFLFFLFLAVAPPSFRDLWCPVNSGQSSLIVATSIQHSKLKTIAPVLWTLFTSSGFSEIQFYFHLFFLIRARSITATCFPRLPKHFHLSHISFFFASPAATAAVASRRGRKHGDTLCVAFSYIKLFQISRFLCTALSYILCKQTGSAHRGLRDPDGAFDWITALHNQGCLGRAQQRAWGKGELVSSWREEPLGWGPTFGEQVRAQRLALQPLVCLQDPAFLTDSDNNLAFLEARGDGLCPSVACVIIGNAEKKGCECDRRYWL